ncbi:Alpha/Beta hydrolase protein [Xylariales sp. PMI_506]|nr:Alpha/Beta hydrolase protein [Xylariales sp. PMI_506]
MSSAPVIRKDYVDTPSGQLHYRYVVPNTANGQILVMLHKSASSSTSYVPLMQHYSTEGYICYAPDMPGFGGSFDPSEDDIKMIDTKGTRWYVDIFMGAFEVLGLAGVGKKPFHVIGHHSGASLGTEMAAVYPDRVASLALVGPSVMSAAERARMKQTYFAPFNKPVPDGSHLQKTWDYLTHMGVGPDLDLQHLEAINHVRAWKGRNQIYGAIWNQDKEKFIAEIKTPVLAMCATDDVLWEHFENLTKIRPDIPAIGIKGANFSLDRDVEGVVQNWTAHIEKASA